MVAVQYTGLAKLGGWLPEQLAPSRLADHVVEDLAPGTERPRLLAIYIPVTSRVVRVWLHQRS